MSKQRSGPKTLIITDDEQPDSEDQNPFSFREFLRWKSQDQDQDQDLEQNQTQSECSLSHSVVEEAEFEKLTLHHRSSDVLTFDPEVRTCFFSDPTLAPQEEEEDGWGRSFQSGVDSTSSLYTEEEEEEEEEKVGSFLTITSSQNGVDERFSSRPEVQQAGGENYEGDDETSIAEPVTSSCRRKSSRSSQIQQLQEENVSLRRSMLELQRRSEANEQRVLVLKEELHQRRRQEEKEAQDLESMVQSVEQNLHLMTKRALKAENCVSKLKVELQQLQMEVDSLRSDNDSLKAAESDIIMTMRRNAQVASEYLNKTASHAHSSISQLLREAETLRLVSELLQSIDKISILDSES